MSTKSIKTDLFTIKTYDSLPCSTETFRIHGKSAPKLGFAADSSDFGVTEDTNTKKAEPFGCGCMKFIPDRTPKAGVLEKYGITRKEWVEIKNALKEALFVGECGWCV